MLNDEFEEGQRHSGTKAHREEKIFPQKTQKAQMKNRFGRLRFEGLGRKYFGQDLQD